MPAQLEIFDIHYAETPRPEPTSPFFTIPLGGEWQPNDWRFVIPVGEMWRGFSYIASRTVSSVGDPYYDLNWSPRAAPAGWSVLATMTIDGLSSGNTYEQYKGTISLGLARRLADSDSDLEYSLAFPAGGYRPGGRPDWGPWMPWTTIYGPAGLLAFTVRGVDPNFAPVGIMPSSFTANTDRTAYTAASRSLSNLPLHELFVMTMYASFATPSGWSTVWDNGYSFEDVVYPSYAACSAGILAKKYTSGSSTGSTVFSSAESSQSTPEGIAKIPFGRSPGFSIAYGIVIQVRQARDATPSLTAGSAETYTSGAMTATFGSVTNPPMLPGDAETYTSGQMFHPLAGYGITNPYLLTGDPVASSRVSWTVTNLTPDHSGVSVSASLDWGRTFTACTNGGPVPGLRRGDTVTGAVLFRVDVWRDDVSVPKPKVYLDPTITLDAGRNELLPLGTFLVKATDIDITDSLPTAGATGAGVTAIGGQSRGQGRAVTLKAVDLSLAASEHVWEQPYYVTPGINYGDALRQMVLDRLPGQTRFDIAATTRVCPLLVYGTVQGADPWQDIRELAYAIGWDCWFNPYGVFVARPVVDPALAEPVFTFRELLGPPVTSIKRSLTRAEVYNHIIVDGAAVSPGTGKAVVPAHGEWRNLDPNHPTYVGGKFGIKPYKVQLPAVTSDEQAVEAATALGIRLREGAETVELIVPPNPTLEPWDVIGLDLADAKLDGNWAILGMDTPGGATRGQRLTVFRQSRQAAA